MLPYLDHDLPIVFAHRGFSQAGDENSMAAFHAAVDLGCTHVETDTQVTRDGVVVAFHDATLDRVTDATGVIADLDWATVSRARINGREPIPTLEQLLTDLPATFVNIDVKARGAAAPTAEVVNRLGAHHRVCLGSFDDAVLASTRRALDTAVTVAAPTNRVRAFVAATRVGWQGLADRALAHVDCLQVPEVRGGVRVVSERAVAMAHAAGTQVHVWTVNEPDRMQRLLDWGVDGIVTDRADLALPVAAAHRWTP